MAEKIDDKKYYELRQEVRKLYKHDTNYEGDLCSRILEIRDKYKCVDSINVSLSDYSISIEFEEGTQPNKIDNIVSLVITRLSEFVEANKDDLNITNKEEFRTFIDPVNYLLCDVIVLGNSAEFCL